jgi:hypothetical protein
MPDKTINCAECHQDFTFTEGEQEFYAAQSPPFSTPKRCKACRDARKAQKNNAADQHQRQQRGRR